MARKTKIKYYSSERIRSMNAQYNMIFGSRSAGKTYDALKHSVEDAWKLKKQFAYIRRYEEDIKGIRGSQLFDALNENGEIKRITGGEWERVKYINRKWYFCRWDEDLQRDIYQAECPIGYAFALTMMEHDKGNSYPNVITIIFDEFLTRTQYLVNDFVLFTNCVSTIVRNRDDVKVFMLGNTVSQYCPYFTEMGLTRIKQMKQGEIDLYEYGDSGLRVAVEYTADNGKEGKPSDVYFAFDSPSMNMIKTGAWDMQIYPHLPAKYVPGEVLFTYFISFDGEMLQCEIIGQNDEIYTYIHRKTGAIKHPDSDIVYAQDYSPRPNYRRRITKPTSSVDKKILEFFIKEKVFYQDNEVGEIVRNYLLWCKEPA